MKTNSFFCTNFFYSRFTLATIPAQSFRGSGSLPNPITLLMNRPFEVGGLTGVHPCSAASSLLAVIQALSQAVI